MKPDENTHTRVQLPTPDLILDSDIFKLLLDQTGTYVFVKNTLGEYVYVNALTQRLFNRELADIIGHDDSHFFDLKVSSDIRKNDRRVLEKGETVIEREVNIIRETGERRIYQTVKQPVYNCEGKIIGLLGVSTDITELYTLKEKLKQLAVTDTLTQALNRQAYNDSIEQHFALYARDGIPFSVILFDIDDFKQINDTYGHHIGDDVLKQVAELIRSQIRKTDRLFRIGGEEFIILLPDTSLTQAAETAEKIRHSAATSLKTPENKPVTLSIGVTEVSPHDDEDSLYRRVDSLMYKSKKTGKNTVSY